MVKGHSSSMMAIMRDAVGSDTPVVCITDDVASFVDTIVARLCHWDQEMGEAIKVYYSPSFLSMRATADEMNRLRRKRGDGEPKITKDKVNNLVFGGVCWIDGRLDAANDD